MGVRNQLDADRDPVDGKFVITRNSKNPGVRAKVVYVPPEPIDRWPVPTSYASGGSSYFLSRDTSVQRPDHAPGRAAPAVGGPGEKDHHGA